MLKVFLVVSLKIIKIVTKLLTIIFIHRKHKNWQHRERNLTNLTRKYI